MLIRSVLTCESRRGICALCYGYNLAEDKLVDIGEPVGVMAAQSIGEPGTQLTLRTFHIGGTASRIVEQNIKAAAADGKIVFSKEVKLVKNDRGDMISIGRKGEINLVRDQRHHAQPHDACRTAPGLASRTARRSRPGAPIFEWDPFADFILAEKAGIVVVRWIIERRHASPMSWTSKTRR